MLEQVIQLKEGEPSLLAGIVDKQSLKNVSGTPYLGELPFFKYFFSSQSKETITDEIVFLLIPHIVRESVLTKANLAAIDTGTSNAVEIRRDEDPARIAEASKPIIIPPIAATNPSNAADAASAAILQMNQPAQVPPAVNRPGVQGAAFPNPAKLPTALAAAGRPELRVRHACYGGADSGKLIADGRRHIFDFGQRDRRQGYLRGADADPVQPNRTATAECGYRILLVARMENPPRWCIATTNWNGNDRSDPPAAGPGRFGHRQRVYADVQGRRAGRFAYFLRQSRSKEQRAGRHRGQPGQRDCTW